MRDALILQGIPILFLAVITGALIFIAYKLVGIAINLSSKHDAEEAEDFENVSSEPDDWRKRIL